MMIVPGMGQRKTIPGRLMKKPGNKEKKNEKKNARSNKHG